MVDALAGFAEEVHARLNAISSGEPEDQLRGPLRLGSAPLYTGPASLNTPQ